MKPTPCDSCFILFTVAMAPVVHIELNVLQDLMSHDDAIKDLKAHAWDAFLKKFKSYNLPVAQTFA
jgi:hypothetical protein